MSETGIIGVVIGMDIPPVQDFAIGYILGAQSVSPDCKVIVSTVGNFFDDSAGYELAERQIELGADVLFNVAGGAGLGVLRAAGDLGCYAIGVDVDQTEVVGDEHKGAIITSCLKNFDALIAVLLEEFLADSLDFGNLGHYGLKEGAVGIARNDNYLSIVPKEIRDEIDAIEAQIVSGDITVRSTFEMTQTEIDSLLTGGIGA